MIVANVGGGRDANTLVLLRFNEWADSSQYRHIVTPTDATALSDSAGGDPVGGGFGSYAYLPGATSATARYFSVDPTGSELADLLTSKNWTIEAWVKAFGVSSSSFNGRWFSKTTLALASTSPITLGLVGSTNQLSVSITTTAGGSTSFFGSLDANWHHYAMTRVGDVLTLYADGFSAFTTTLAAELATNAGQIRSGAVNSLGTVFGSNCMIDDFRISRVVRYDNDFTPPGPHKR